MSKIVFNDHSIELEEGQTILSALLQHGYDIPHSCQAGVCQSCLMRADKGTLPDISQKGLKPGQIEQGYFLACCCTADSDLEISQVNDVLDKTPARLIHKQQLNHDVVRLQLKPESDFSYHSGQYTTLWANGIGRSYSLASVPQLDQLVELHIRRIEGGQLSTWLFDTFQAGDMIELQAPTGNSFYTANEPDQPLLLLGTGTGLAPLYGIVRDALHQNHRGEIHLIHGSVRPDGLYLHSSLQQLAQRYGNFHYHPCVLDNQEQIADIAEANIETLAFGVVEQPGDWNIYLCGDPQTVNNMKKRFFLAGAQMKNIHSDPFIHSPGTSA